MLQYISEMQIVSRADPTRVNQTASALLQAPYQPFPNGTERWPRFAAHFCRYTCHRDSLYWWTYPSAADIRNDTRHAFLNRIDPGTNAQQAIIRCVKCPPYFRAYEWGLTLPDNTYDSTRPADPRALIVSFNCWPHFGAIPQLTVSTVNPTSPVLVFFNGTTVFHSSATDGVFFPPKTASVHALPCAVNTYNDKCAHYYVYGGQGVPSACTPCPSGFHTAGQVGAWYCLPPAGQTIALAPGSSTVSPRRNVLTLFRDPATNLSLAWARRDLLGYEWECGTEPTHCWQCAQYGLPATTTPDGFNQAMILQPLLVWQACPSGYYCPTAVDSPPIACPSWLPWSPPGSASLADCTCAARTYRTGPTSCAPCLVPSAACGTGQYLQGYVRCMGYGGATSGGVCVPCTNKPANAAYLAGAGLEVSNGTSSFYGVCPFACPVATQLTVSQSGCAAQTSCDAVPPLYLGVSGGPRVYAPALQNWTDRFLTTSATCPLDAQLSLRLAAAASSCVDITSAACAVLPASTSCAAASPAVCASACYVVKPATFYSDYVCAPCAPPPSNSTIVPQALAASCVVQCLPGFFFNASSNACASCAALNQRVCPLGSFLRGGGCYGNSDPLPTLTDMDYLRTHNCVICDLDIAAVLPGYFLNVFPSSGGKCAFQLCARGDGVTTYTATPCSGTTNSVVSACVTACPRGSWLQGTCSATTSPVCTPCTTFKAGAYNVSACGVRSDAVWVACGVDAVTGAFTPGLYCPGDGSVRTCSNFKTSRQGAASDSRDCFCPVGTELSDDGLSCRAVHCADAAVDASAPGAGWTSASYLGDGNACTACGGGGAFSVGDGIGASACVCPPGLFLGSTGCSACPSTQQTCVGGGYYTAVPNTCWTGRTRGVACECLLPPFAVDAGGCAAVTGCATGFDVVPGLNGGSKPTTHAAGSAMYVPSATTAWDPLYTHNPAAHEDGEVTNGYVIGDLACTSDFWDPNSLLGQRDGWGSPDNYQYAVWLLAQAGHYQVYAVPLPGHRAPSYDPYLNFGVWSVLEDGYASPSALLRLAVAQWPVAQTPARFTGSGNLTAFSVPTDVGVVARDNTTGVLYLYHNSLAVDLDAVALGAPAWGPGTNPAVNLTVLRGGDCVGFGHAYAVPGGSTSTNTARLSTFYVASDAGIVVAVRVWDSAVFVLRTGFAGTRAMTLLPRPDGLGVNVYLATSADNRIQLVEWTSSSSTAPAAKEGLFFSSSTGGTIRQLLPVLWPSTVGLAPTFLAVVESPMGGVDTAEPILHPGLPKRAVWVADATQRTLVPIPNMPPQTRFASAAVTGMGIGSALLVASAGSDLFTLRTSVCAARTAGTSGGTVPTYWDGAQCLTHVCVRASACATDGGQMWDPHTLRCVCAPGYWTYLAATATTDLQCRLCTSTLTQGTYCPGNGTSLLCPYSSMTAPAGATAVTDCVCRVGQFFDASAKQCAACAAGMWCPNQWTALPCPGAADATSSIAGLPYPSGCLCRSGYTDVRCAACPAPSICPPSTLNQVVNNAFALQLAGTVTSDPCADVLWPKLAAYLSVTRIGYLTRADQLAGRLTCTFVPAPPDRTNVSPLAVIIVQTESADASNTLIGNMPANLLQQTAFFAGSTSVVGVVSAIVVPQSIANNTPTACASGKAPTVPDATACVCAPGFASSGTNGACTQCGAGSYKAALGPGACAACPVGATSPVGASACIGATGGTNSTGGGGGGGLSTTTLIIIGSVGGGIVVVGGLVWLFVSLMGVEE